MESHKHFNIPNYGLQQAQLTIPNSTPCRHRLPWYYKAAIEVAPPSMPHTIFTDPLDTRLGVVTGWVAHHRSQFAWQEKGQPNHAVDG